MVTPAARARAAERIVDTCRAPHNALSLRLAILDELRKVIRFDAHAWLLTDPRTEVGSAPLANVPSVADLPRLIRLKYLTSVNRWTALAGSVGFLRAATEDDPQRSLIWREMLRGYGVSDVASVVFRDRFGCWGFLDLWRIDADSRFSDDDAQLLQGVAGPATAAMRRAQALTFTLSAPTPSRGGPSVLVLSPSLEVRTQTRETEDYLRVLVPPDGDARPIPAGAYNVAAQLLAVAAGVDDHAPSARVHLAAGMWLTMRAARLGGDTHPADPDIAVTFEPSSPAERIDLFSRCHALTDREAQLLGHLASGSDTHATAQSMFLSENTVHDHLKSMFTKTGTRNRRSMLAHALGS